MMQAQMLDKARQRFEQRLAESAVAKGFVNTMSF